MLLGRSGECACLDGLLEQARHGRSAALVLRGEAGIGKTALLSYAAERARAGDMIVLSGRGAESESELPFSGLAELLEPVLDRLGLIPEPQAAALRGAFALGPPTAGDPFAIFAATLSLLAEAAEERPLLAAVDDAHWLDASSVQALLFTARRLQSEGVVLVVAVREDEQAALDWSELSGLEIRALDSEDARTLLVGGGAATIAAHVVDELVRTARGNPLALLELPSALSPDQLAGRDPLDDPLPLGPVLERPFQHRLEALPDPARKALLVAAAGDGDAPGEVLAAAGRLGLDRAALEPAEMMGIISIEGGALEWRHPLLRSAVYRGACAPDRREAHHALAGVLSDADAADRRAWHLAAGALSADEEVASALEQAALRARGRRGHAAAAEAFERAAGLTPGPLERARRLLEAGRDGMLAGRPQQCLAVLDEALALGGDEPLMRADIQWVRGQLEMWDSGPATAYRLLVSEAERIEELDPERAALMLSDACLTCTMTGDIAAVLATARRAAKVSERAGSRARSEADAMLGNGLILSGDAASAAPHLVRLRSMLSEGALPSPGVIHTAGHGSIWVEDYAEARVVLERAISAARAGSAGGLLSFPLSLLSELDYRTGRWAAAYAGAAEAARVAGDAGQLTQAAFSYVCWAYVEAAQGREAECREHAEQAIELATRSGGESIATYGESVLGLLELGLGRPEQAIAHLDEAGQRMERHGMREPGVVWWQPDLIESHALLGAIEEAGRALVSFEQQAQRTGRTWALAAAHRCRGMLADNAGFESEFAAALRWHEQTPTPFERARTELRLGERLRRARRPTDARGALRSALETFERLGADPWSERARAELAASGEKASPGGQTAALRDLTPRELQTAMLVAKGLTNREVAAALFLSPKTVEYHLAKVYGKLAVRSRTELALLLTRTGASSEVRPPSDVQGT